jgi:CheY-like chemotaxis protein
MGIPAELLPRIFEPFMQEQLSENRIQGGLGIGLALVRNLIDLHGGRVEAFSDGRGHGSEFAVHLPTCAAPTAPRVRITDVATPAAPPRHVLVVDDNRDAAQSLAILLRLNGHNVHTAHDGQTALDMARTHRPEIILLDIGMPRMDGLEVARRIRHELGLTQVLLVALTGYGRTQDRHRSSAAGFDAHLVKPVGMEELRSILAKPDGTPSGISEPVD